LVLSGTSPDKRLVEMIELPVSSPRAGAPSHPHFVACQFHPEFKSRPTAPHPLFTRFVEAALEHRDSRTTGASRTHEELRSVN
jgi:CTP synthase